MSMVTGIYETRGVVRISVDGCTLCAVRSSTFQKFPLTQGDAIDTQAYIDRVAAAQSRAAYEAALSMLARSARTSEQIKRSLAQKGYVTPAVEAAIERLTEVKLLDDRAVAERMGEVAAQKPVGRYALARKLRSKGLSDDDVEAALEHLDEDQQRAAAQQMLKKLMPRYEGQEPRAARAKLNQALARRGYSWGVIYSVLDEAFNGEDMW